MGRCPKRTSRSSGAHTSRWLGATGRGLGQRPLGFHLRTQLAGSYRGPDEAQRFIEDRFGAFESFTAEPVEYFEGDDQVVVFVTQRAQPKGSSAVIEIKTGDVWTLRDGKVLTLETFPQREKALEAAGLRE